MPSVITGALPVAVSIKPQPEPIGAILRSKEESFYGLRAHVIVTASGRPVEGRTIRQARKRMETTLSELRPSDPISFLR
ncbi:MAG TPA: hypothetical protein VFB21_06895 [Chthonomonadaceae bacterium]|nr:hypothetical protein [Chthonomonadaceae bacterium]